MSKKARSEGFTLVELSIVLVIIGLIVGGILTGQDLIKAAEQRATIAQLEKYNTAANTFRIKYNYIPGDLPAASAVNFGLTGGTAGTAGTTGLGDGNGLITDTSSPNYNTPVGEVILFWYQLSQAGLIDGTYGADINLTTGVTSATTASTDQPLAKLGRGNYIIVGSDNVGSNYFGITGITSELCCGAGTATYSGSMNLTAMEAYSIDKKKDDGMPNTGSVQARNSVIENVHSSMIAPLTGSNAAVYSATPGNGDCITGSSALAANAMYDVGASGTYANYQACALIIKFN